VVRGRDTYPSYQPIRLNEPDWEELGQDNIQVKRLSKSQIQKLPATIQAMELKSQFTDPPSPGRRFNTTATTATAIQCQATMPTKNQLHVNNNQPAIHVKIQTESHFGNSATDGESNRQIQTEKDSENPPPTINQ
jgi:hypothetical protein